MEILLIREMIAGASSLPGRFGEESPARVGRGTGGARRRRRRQQLAVGSEGAL
jgi:hypothetical protein